MLRGYVEALLALTPEDWERVSFLREPRSRRLTGEQKRSLYLRSLDEGRREALSLRDKYGDLPPERLIPLCGGQIREETKPPDPRYALFGSFEPPDLITVNTAAVREGSRLIGEYDLAPLLGPVDLRQQLLAHELCHLLMSRRGADAFVKQKHAPALRLGPLCVSRPIPCLEETAAMAFSEALMGLRRSPYILNVVMLYAFDPRQAARLLSDYTGKEGSL